MLKLLIVDDESFVRKGLIQNICWTELGIHSIEQADDGVKALEVAALFKPDIVLSDIKMPNMTGIEMAQKLKKILPDCKIIFMSAYSDKEYLKSAISLKAISYVDKPIDLDEIKQVITTTVELCRDEQSKRSNLNELRNILKENLFLTKNNIVLDLIKRKMNTHYIKDILDLGEIKFSTDMKFGVFVTKLKNTDIQQYQIQDCIGKIQDVLSTSHIYGISGYKSNVHIVTVIQLTNRVGEYMENDTFIRVGREIVNSLKSCHDVFVGIGKPVKGMENIYQSYETAVMALQYLFFKGYNKSAVYEEEPAHNTFHIDESVIQGFKDTLDTGGLDDVKEYLRRLTMNFKLSKEKLPNHIKDVYVKLLSILYDVAEKRGMDILETNDERFYWESLSRLETLEEVEEYVQRKVSAFYDIIQEIGTGCKVAISVMKIIEKEYANKELSIKSISQSIFLSEAYICVVFKKEIGKTINQYISDVRIDKAKELLKDKSVKMFDIAMKVGYRDHNYFTKIFKKKTGMTPSEYKEKFLV